MGEREGRAVDNAAWRDAVAWAVEPEDHGRRLRLRAAMDGEEGALRGRGVVAHLEEREGLVGLRADVVLTHALGTRRPLAPGAGPRLRASVPDEMDVHLGRAVDVLVRVDEGGRPVWARLAEPEPEVSVDGAVVGHGMAGMAAALGAMLLGGEPVVTEPKDPGHVPPDVAERQERFYRGLIDVTYGVAYAEPAWSVEVDCLPLTREQALALARETTPQTLLPGVWERAEGLMEQVARTLYVWLTRAASSIHSVLLIEQVDGLPVTRAGRVPDPDVGSRVVGAEA